jgi:hypothetical protein
VAIGQTVLLSGTGVENCAGCSTPFTSVNVTENGMPQSVGVTTSNKMRSVVPKENVGTELVNDGSGD